MAAAGTKEGPDLGERLAVSQYLEERGLHYTLSLLDQDKQIAGIACIRHHNDAVAYINYRDPNYNWHGAMTRLMDLSFYWARDMGFEKMDLGGSFDYKEKWAPEDGHKWEFEIGPLSIYLKNCTLRFICGKGGRSFIRSSKMLDAIKPVNPPQRPSPFFADR